MQPLKTRRAVAATLFGLLLPAFIGMSSLAVDVAMIATARGQLRVAADAAALAAAVKLGTQNRLRGTSDLSAEISAANEQAYSFARKNKVLNAAPVLSLNATNQPGGDIVVGRRVENDPSAPLDTSAAAAPNYDSVQVTLRRDAAHGGVVPTIFAGLTGFPGSSVSVVSTATIRSFAVAGVASNGSSNVNLLPIVLDKPTWQAMMARTTLDQYSYNTTTGAVSAGADGITESKLYPVANGSPGNWGTIKVGVSNNSTSTLSSQIEYGITPQQMATFPGGVIKLDDALSPPSITFSGNPGISAGIKASLNAIIGKPVLVPIYDQNGGNGNNAWYRVIAFQPARILDVNFQGSNKYVIIQPCLMDVPELVKGKAQGWTDGGQLGLFLSR
jgi:hypothetical protein